jgi:intein/homing endonuclease
MKGTLFSADFALSSDNELKLIEVNTDTSIAAHNLGFFDYSEFISVLENNNITKVTVIHKPAFHQAMVTHLASELTVSAPFITTFTEIHENINSMYPTLVPDAEDLFILRLSYDDSSIFDNEYAKGTLNLLKLFNEYGESGSVVEFYHSSSLNGEYNTLNFDTNPSSIPDCVIKHTTENGFSKFYKVGSESESDTPETRWNNFIGVKSDEDCVIQKYHVNSDVITENRTCSIRAYSIIYGSNLDLISLGQFKPYSLFELPTESIYNTELYVNEIDMKHYYEFATNVVKIEAPFDGILNTHLVIKSDETEVEVGSLSVGDELKSYYIGGTNQNETEFSYLDWSIEGDTFPSGSYMTSSVVVYKNVKDLTSKTLCNINVNEDDGDSLFVAYNKSFLVYDSLVNSIKWKGAMSIIPDTDYLIDYDGSTAQVSFNNLIIVNEDTFKLVEIDVEDTDTYIIAGSTPVNSFVTHNAPCFVAGTKITMEDGTVKNIEEVVSGDVVSTFDLKENKIVSNIVNNVFSKQVNTIVKYVFENGESVKCTIDHPLYVVNKGWSSFSEELSNKLYSIEDSVKKIELFDVVKLYNGDTKIIEIELIHEDVMVYNLQDIENNHNFFANNVLVHNRSCFVAGTEIELINDEIKSIEDVKMGDVVLSFNEKTNTKEYNKVIDIKNPIHNDLVTYHFSNETSLTCTYDHPIYVNGLDIASFKPELTNTRYQIGRDVTKIKIGDVVNLSTDTQSIIEKIEILELVDTQTYIITVENNHNFYANKILVHNK